MSRPAYLTLVHYTDVVLKVVFVIQATLNPSMMTMMMMMDDVNLAVVAEAGLCSLCVCSMEVFVGAGCCISSRTSTWMPCRLTSAPYSWTGLTVLPGLTSAYSTSRVASRRMRSSATAMPSTRQNVQTLVICVLLSEYSHWIYGLVSFHNCLWFPNL